MAALSTVYSFDSKQSVNLILFFCYYLMKMGSSSRTQRSKKSRVFHGNGYTKKQNVNMNSISDNIPGTSSQTFGHAHSRVSKNGDNLSLGSVNSRNNTELAYNILDTEWLQNIIAIVA
jgi:hypothetical protein